MLGCLKIKAKPYVFLGIKLRTLSHSLSSTNDPLPVFVKEKESATNASSNDYKNYYSYLKS